MRETAKEFRAFLLRQNAFALAIGVIIGAAIGKVVSGIAEDVLMPLIGVVLPGGDWRNAQLVLSGQNAIKYGDLAGRVVDFVLIAAVVFFLTRAFLEQPAPAPATKTCPDCLEPVPLAARKCRACGSSLQVA